MTFGADIDPMELEDIVSRALAEDIGLGDVTANAIVDPKTRARAHILQKSPGVIFGFQVAELCFRHLDGDLIWRPLEPEAVWRDSVPARLVELEANARAMLAAERVALNFLGQLSGVASGAARLCEALHGHGTRLLDTRKTVPGLRALQKQAVRAGGGRNHRMGLFDGILVKDNHVAIAGSVGEAVRRARASNRRMPVVVEVVSLEEAREALAGGADRLLLDNMEPDTVAEIVRQLGKQVELEASGGIDTENVEEYAAAGVDFVSVGAITHSSRALDVSLDIVASR